MYYLIKGHNGNKKEWKAQQQMTTNYTSINEKLTIKNHQIYCIRESAPLQGRELKET